MFGSVNPWCGEPPTGEPDAGEPHVRFGGRRDRATGLSYPYHAAENELDREGQVGGGDRRVARSASHARNWI